MPQLLEHIIEWFVVGAATITCFYHAILYLQQRDKFLLLYAHYLFSLVIFLFFKLFTGYYSFSEEPHSWGYVLDHPLILYMLFSYVLFITRALDLDKETKIAKLSANLFNLTIIILVLIHFVKVFAHMEYSLSRNYFVITKLILTTFAFAGLSGAWYIRKNTFKRIIVAGGFVFAFFSLLGIISIYTQQRIAGLYEYELYYVGCLLDILIFSSALGYRNYLMHKEKLATQELLVIESEKIKGLLQIQHDLLQKENSAQQTQMRINKQLQDEVGASLSSVHVYADLAAQIISSNPEKSKEYLAKISQQSQQLMDDIGDIIWAANLDEAGIHEAFLTRIRNYAHEILTPHSIECTYAIHADFYSNKLSTDVVRNSLQQIKSGMKVAIEKKSRSILISINEINGSLVITVG